MTLECAERWGLYNENDAAIWLENLLNAERPELAARLEFDPETDFMVIHAHSREDLESVARIAASASGPDDPVAWTNKLFEGYSD